MTVVVKPELSGEPLSLKDAPALIESLLPVQKLSAEAYKEQEGRQSKTLTPLGSYWKGRKPLILVKACVLGCLLPATDDPTRDLEIFEKLMAMDDESMTVRLKRKIKPEEILAKLSIPRIADYFMETPMGVLPISAPVDWSKPEYKKVKVAWREDIDEFQRRQLQARVLPQITYRKRLEVSERPEAVMDTVHDHIWSAVNAHLGTNAYSIPELVEQLGTSRFGQRPRIADTFCGSGQIPFEAARLGCDVYAADLNPVACMLTWGGFHVVGGQKESRNELKQEQQQLVSRLRAQIDQLGIETDCNGWQAKVFLYCVEARCPQTGWMVPLLPTFVISTSRRIIAELVPNTQDKRYDIEIRCGVSEEELAAAAKGTVGRESRFGDAFLTYSIDGVNHKTKISTLRGDFEQTDGTLGNRVRRWEKSDFKPGVDDIFQERLYCIQWKAPTKAGRSEDSEFRAVTADDLERERKVEAFMTDHLAEWQENGWLPDMRIEPGGPPRYQGLSLIRARGWTHWHHLFNPRQLLVGGLINQFSNTSLKFALTQALNLNCRLSRFDNSEGGAAATKGAFDNQALNELFNYGCRATEFLVPALSQAYPSFPLDKNKSFVVENKPAAETSVNADIYITDPPYGDAVKYEEILDFFIAWLRKNPPSEFLSWVWDSRRPLAISGESEDFRRGMVAELKSGKFRKNPPKTALMRNDLKLKFSDK